MSVVYENALFRIKRVAKPVTGDGGVRMTPQVIAQVESVLRGRTPPNTNSITLPQEALAALGVDSTDQLEISVEGGRIILSPRREE